MEENTQTHNHTGLPSTIIIGILLTGFLIYALLMIPVDMNSMVAQSQQSSSTSASTSVNPAGQAIGNAAAAGVVALFVVLFHIGFFAAIAVCGILTIFMVKNLKSPQKAIKITNIVYLCLAGIIVTISVVKLIILFAR